MSDYSLRPGYAEISPEELPEGWSAKRLGEVVRVSQGGRLGLTKENHYVSNGIPAYSAAGQDGFVERVEFVNQAGVVLSAIGANCGRCFYADGDWTTLANVQALLPTEELNARFLYYRASIENFWTRSGSAQPFIKPSSIKASWIAYPRPHLQRHIAQILSTVDETIERTEALVAKLQQMKAGLMHDLFTRGVTPNGHLRPTRTQAPHIYQNSPLGWIPKQWVLSTVGECLIGIDAGKSPECPDTPASGDQWGVLKVGAIDPEGFRAHENKVIVSDRLKNAAFLVRDDDLLLSRANTFDLVGLVCLVADSRKNLMLSDKTLRLQPNQSRTTTRFLFWALQTPSSRRQIENSATGTSGSMKNISQAGVRAIQMARPAASEQSRITERIDSVANIISSLRTELAKLRQLKQGLMHDLLTGRVRVPASKSASA